MTPLTQDHGPAWREALRRQRAKREHRGWPRLRLRHVAYVAIALLVIGVAAVGVYPTLALAGEPVMPSGYTDFCADDEDNCPEVVPVVLPYSGILQAHLERASSIAGRMRHIKERPGQNRWRETCYRGDCEDKAACIRKVLFEQGYARGAVRFVHGLGERGLRHAWVVVQTTAGPIYLDDRQVAFVHDWQGEAWSQESFEGYTPGYGYAWRPVLAPSPSTGAYALMQDKDQ